MLFKIRYCYVYIVECADGTFYTGVTWNLRIRLNQHNGLLWGGAKYTRSHRPVTLVYFERFDSRSEALKREYEIKQMSHEQKSELVDSASKEQILAAI